MSGNADEDKPEPGKSFPLDLASKLTAVKTIDAKTSIIAGQQLRNMRLLHTSAGGQTSVGTPTIITTNIPQIIKQNQAQAVSGTITVQRPTQITLTTANLPVVAQNVGATYHVPRGPAVVANLAAPRSNVATARGPLVVAQNTQSFARPPRTPSPATGGAWLAAASNGAQLKASSTILSPPIKGTSVTGTVKPQIIGRSQTTTQSSVNLRPAPTILQSAITVGQGGQIHSFNKPGQTTSTIQAIGNTVTIAQVLPARTQTLVYSTVSNSHFGSNPRVTIANSFQGQRQISTQRPIVSARLPVNIPQGGTRLVAPQILTTGARISTVSSSQQPTIIGAQRIITTTPSSNSVGRLTSTLAQSSSGNIVNPKILPTLSLHPIVAVATSAPTRVLQPQATKVITQQTAGGSIHLTQLPSGLKSGQSITPTTRTINVQPATIVAQRQGSVVSSQNIPIAKVFQQQQGENQNVQPVYIHAPVTSLPRRTSPGPTSAAHTLANVPTTTVPAYSIASGTYFYDNYSRPFGQQQSSFAAITPVTTQQRPTSLGIVTNPSIVNRFNHQIMVVGGQPFASQQDSSNSDNNLSSLTTTPTKLSSSPRPSILRKRDYEGTPLKSAKNLQSVFTALTQPPQSPPSRPDSAGNGNSSAGSTTISATSSPGPGEGNDDSLPPMPMNKEEEENRPPLEMSPRKKPRKQQLTGNDIMDEHSVEMQFLSESHMKKDEDSDGNRSDVHREDSPDIQNNAAVRKATSASLLNSYRQTWKTTQNHFLRYSDVRPKEERKPTIMDLANQCKVLDKVNGWKVHHLTTQMLDMAEQGDSVYRQLEDLLKLTESHEDDNEVNRVNELIKGNLQRIKVINEGMIEAKTNLMKVFDHKVHVTDIINRCASKRNFKKRDKS